jgi:hypothetical protein
MERILRYADDFTELARQFQRQGDHQRMVECLALAMQCLQAARAIERLRHLKPADA